MYRHVTQSNIWCCGAACMQMVYEYFGLSFPQEEIWQKIVRFDPYWIVDCGPENMQKHFHARGFCCMIFAAYAEPISFLPWIEQQGLSVIVNYTISENHYHFVLFERTTGNGIIVQDPSEESADTFLPFEAILEPQYMLISKGTNYGLCPNCKNSFPTNEFFSQLYAKHVARCAYCQEELFYITDIHGAPLALGNGSVD